ncbi:hypothetical protein ACTJJ0_12505 [Chitinophaga sp. 22321]|uniref:Uncharacterized protein n=1 Tax=Chitinophaga hostae TaxID=2831022 RepID=A0ABS5IWN6_9BACT|nr:hypothetical protein [Chitinophaga hostae]MBS0027280.1 hypothetical protein [Chitinophaga hostae]
MKTVITLVCLLLMFNETTYAQDSITQLSPKTSLKYLSQVKRKADGISRRITNTSDKTLERFLKSERKIKAKLRVSNPAEATSIFVDSFKTEQKLLHSMKSKLGKVSGLAKYTETGGTYLDSLSGSLSYLSQANNLLGKSGNIGEKLRGTISSVDILKDKLEYAEQIKAFIRERKKQLTDQLSQYTGFSKEVQGLKKEAYYYSAQLREYKEVLKDQKKAEQKAMELLRKIPAFNDFMAKNSMLAGLFNIQSGSELQAGLQTRTQVEQMIEGRVGSGPNATALVNQQMDAAKSKFDELKKKFPALSDAGEMPGFKPKEMKSKSLLQRLEFGSNIQFQRSNQFFPTTSDLAGQVAYKFHKNGSVGIGLSYKLGLGTGFNNIRFSSQGMGLRSFVDWKLKGTFFLNGGYEQNYQPEYTGIPIRIGQQWTQSGLLGISKKYKINSKLKGNVMVLFDFLYNQHIPRTEPIKLRTGYNF